ncbi:hypothetical protein [Flavobacterium nitratireducens]|uniref:hypothetical protein n=1 Tax=Flavobacterium nitratireducens TaxID=992289 RepID=UPI00241547F6|nr:hypothetical protein [Flavobacterium nitratireducens]
MNYIEEINAIEELVGQKLADESTIEPVDERACFGAIIAYLRKISPLASNTFSIGDVFTPDIRTVNLPYNVGTSDYRVVGTLVSKSSNANLDKDIVLTTKDKTPTSFKIILKEIPGVLQDIDFEWAIYPKNT